MAVEGTKLRFDIFSVLRGRGLKDLEKDARDAEDALDDLDDVNTRLSKATPDSLRALRAQRDGLRGVADAAYKARHAVDQAGGGRHRLADIVPDVDPKQGHNLGTRIGSAMARGIAKGLNDGSRLIGDTLLKLPPQAQAGIVAAIAGAVVGLGAMLNGLLLSTLSAGAVAAGVALAVRHPQVKAAGADLGKTLMAGLSAASSSFVDPVLSAIDIIKAEFRGMGGDLKSFFGAASKFVEPLARGLTGMAREALPGLTRALENSGPVVDALADGFVQLGESIGDSFAILSQGSDGAAAGLRDLFAILDFGLRGTASTIAGWSKIWQYAGFTISPALKAVTFATRENADEATRAVGKVTMLGQAAGTAGPKFSAMALDLNAAAASARTLNEALAAGPANLLSIEQANLQAEESYLDLGAAIKAQNADQRISYQEYLNTKGALLSYAGSVQTAAQRTRDLTGDQNAANNIIATGRSRFIAAGIAAGMEAREVNNLANKLFGLPSPKPKVTVLGKQAAEKAINDINAAANRAARARTIWFTVAQAGSLGAIGQRAEGGPVRKGQPYLVGEKGPELVTPERDGYVHTSSATSAMLSRRPNAAPAAAGGGAAHLTVSAAGGGRPVEQAMASMFMSLVRSGAIRLMVDSASRVQVA